MQVDEQAASSSTFPQPPTLRQLYGGACTCEVFGDFDDVSAVRQVPDEQEVFCSRNFGADSLIIELLADDAFSKSDPRDAVRFHFADLAKANQAAASEVLQCQSLPPVNFAGKQDERTFCSVAAGWQQCSNRTGQVEDKVFVLVGCVRYEKYKTDVLITLNCGPLGEDHQRRADDSSAAEQQTGTEADKDTVAFWGDAVVSFLKQEKQAHAVSYLRTFAQILNSFRVVDDNLFVM
ncbi:unnamed protein product [Amoebophrya sp. A120]|nr:unnamed protein product [Amoebophrya sp. A120]|eukprot:GSA120T00002712001.1